MKEADIFRWKLAQDSEREYWDGYDKESLLKEDLKVYPKRVKYLLKEWSDFKKIKSKTKILQIGCGPEDIINYLKNGDKYAIDPLADFYKKKFKLNYKDVKFIKGIGEKLPYKNKFFDIVILTNVLDHTKSPEKVLQESSRVLKDDGIFHFEVLTYQKGFLVLAQIFSFLKKLFLKEVFNIHHPFMFQKKEIKKMLSKEFKILKEDYGKSIVDRIENLEDLKRQRKTSNKLSVKIPAIFGLYGLINYTAICKKNLENLPNQIIK